MKIKGVREKLEEKVFDDITVVKYLGKKQYLTICNKCGEQRILYGNNIKNHRGIKCTQDKKTIDLTGQQIGEWYVIKYIGKKKYRCRCSCGNVKEVLKANLINGSSTSCGHNKKHYNILIGQQFGEWTVLEKAGYKWKCKCSCGKIGYNMARDMISGRTKSCGHDYNKFTLITGQQFGEWLVGEYKGNQYYECRCSCGTIKIIRKADLLSGATTSCGCKKVVKTKYTLYSRYGEIAPNRINNPRGDQQLLAVRSAYEMYRFIQSLDHKPTSIELANLLDIGLHRTLTLIHKYGLDESIIISQQASQAELDIINYIENICKYTVEHKTRDVLNGKELDIYIPEKQLAIEFNGTYWHSTVYKDANYHQNKVKQCYRLGIRLVHIYEYQWNDASMHIKILELLNSILNDNYDIDNSIKYNIEIQQNTIYFNDIIPDNIINSYINKIKKCVDYDIVLKLRLDSSLLIDDNDIKPIMIGNPIKHTIHTTENTSFDVFDSGYIVYEYKSKRE